MNATPILTFEHVAFRYPAAAQPVMEDFNLAIEPGSVTAILGPNGAGKTTLLHLILGWLRPQAGRVTLDGRPLAEYSRREMGRRVGLVPQSDHSPFEFSLLDYVLLGRAPHLAPLAMPGPEDLRAAAAALERVGMGALQNRSILTLSGGERQLVLAARALAQQPGLMLLDEPTSHLDLSNKGRLVRLLRELAGQGVTILFTTHEPEVASALATHLVLVQKGRVLETGPFDAIFTTPALTRLYQMPVQVATVEGRKVALWE